MFAASKIQEGSCCYSYYFSRMRNTVHITCCSFFLCEELLCFFGNGSRRDYDTVHFDLTFFFLQAGEKRCQLVLGGASSSSFSSVTSSCKVMFVGASFESVHDALRRSVSQETYLAGNSPNESNASCTLLLEDKNLKDGKIPQLLGLCLAVWLVRSTMLWFRLAVKRVLSVLWQPN